jgi:hypothetical protein
LSTPEIAALLASFSFCEISVPRRSAVPAAISEALRASFVDGVEVDVGRLPCTPSLDPLLSPVANVLHRIEQIACDTGVHLHGECFSAADLFFVTHDGISNAHWLHGCSLEVVPSADLHLPVGSILMVLQEELRRVIDNGFTWKALRAAFKNIVARVAPKSGLVFLLKKAGLVIGSALLGTTGALLLGVLGVFAGSWLGAKIGRYLLEWSYAIARSQLLLHGQHMELVIPRLYEEALHDIRKAATEQRAQCEKELRRSRLNQYRTLLKLRRAEDEEIDVFLDQFREILDYMSVKQRRNLARIQPHLEPTLIARLFRRKTARDRVKFLHKEFDAAEERLNSGRACLDSPGRMARLTHVLAWFGQVTVNSARMGHALAAFTASIKAIEEKRAGVLKGFPATEHDVIQNHAKALSEVCERIAEACMQKITKETQEADRRIEILQTRGKEIGVTVEVKRSWKSAA